MIRNTFPQIGDIVYLIHQAAIIEDILVGFDIVKVRYLHNFDEFYTDISAISLMPNIEINTLDIKVSQLCLIMRICGWGDSCSLIKLQMISYALFSSETMSQLINYAEGYGPAPIVHFDPAVNKALTFAIAYGFVSQQRNGNYKLTTKGHNLAERIKIVGDLMTSELSPKIWITLLNPQHFYTQIVK